MGAVRLVCCCTCPTLNLQTSEQISAPERHVTLSFAILVVRDAARADLSRRLVPRCWLQSAPLFSGVSGGQGFLSKFLDIGFMAFAKLTLNCSLGTVPSALYNAWGVFWNFVNAMGFRCLARTSNNLPT